MRAAISVVICTYNRAAVLPAAIESVIAQSLPREKFEIIVVDNGSSDDTQRVVARYATDVSLIAEPKLGLSHARNAGWRAATAPYVALLDDDAIADRGWLEAVLHAFEQTTTRPACVGGRILPQWDAPRPRWLSDRMALNLTVIDWSADAHAITDLTREWLAGANLSFERRVLEEAGGFRSDLGRIGTHLLSGEEILLQRHLLRRGEVCWYEPRALVHHRIAADRLTPAWFRRRSFAQGLSDAKIWHLENDAKRGAMRLVLAEAKPLLRAGLGVPGFFRRVSDPLRFEDDCGLLWRFGFVRGLMAGK